MPLPEAFNIETKEGTASLRLNEKLLYENNAVVTGGKLSEEVEARRTLIQDKLDKMQKEAKGRLNMNADEFKFALHVMEEELESSIPDGFREAYRSARTPEEAVNVIAEGILSRVNAFVAKQTKEVINKETGVLRRIPTGGPSRAEYIAEKAAELGVFSLEEADAKAMLRSINASKEDNASASSGITDDQINAIWNNYSNPERSPNVMATGVRALAGRDRDDRINRATGQ